MMIFGTLLDDRRMNLPRREVGSGMGSPHVSRSVSDIAFRPNRTLFVLFVDDESENLTLFKLAFGDDFEVLTAAGGAEAIAVLERTDVGVLVSDERMPGMTGIELLSETFRRWPDTVRVIVSAYGDAARLLAAINRGHASEYILKPWNSD